MTELDKTKNNVPISTQTRREVLAKFMTYFSGGVTPNTMLDSGKTALAQVSANMDSRVVHTALKNGGHSTTRLEGSFLQMVPLESDISNVLQKLPDKVIHIAAAEQDPLIEEASKPSIIVSDLSDTAVGRPARIYHINVVSTEIEPSEDIKPWFYPDKKLKSAA